MICFGHVIHQFWCLYFFKNLSWFFQNFLSFLCSVLRVSPETDLSHRDRSVSVPADLAAETTTLNHATTPNQKKNCHRRCLQQLSVSLSLPLAKIKKIARNNWYAWDNQGLCFFLPSQVAVDLLLLFFWRIGVWKCHSMVDLIVDVGVYAFLFLLCTIRTKIMGFCSLTFSWFDASNSWTSF